MGSIYLTIAWLVNFVFLVLTTFFGLLGVTGRLADVSEHENQVLGGVLLCLALAAAVNVVSLSQRGVWRSRLRWTAYAVNSGLLLFAGVGWWQQCREHHLFLGPPPQSAILIAIGLMSLCAAVFQSREGSTTTNNKGEAIESSPQG